MTIAWELLLPFLGVLLSILVGAFNEWRRRQVERPQVQATAQAQALSAISTVQATVLSDYQRLLGEREAKQKEVDDLNRRLKECEAQLPGVDINKVRANAMEANWSKLLDGRNRLEKDLELANAALKDKDEVIEKLRNEVEALKRKKR